VPDRPAATACRRSWHLCARPSRAARITGTVADWEGWTGTRFADSGSYVVPDGLVPVDIDVGRDLGTYVEPNVWVRRQPQAAFTKG